ncbi:MAG: SRPBCC family protein [Chloroflexi bacterium]|nr:SRPBCC family protein [Chloroflexota bacterium]
MPIVNIHERMIDAPVAQVSTLLDRLASADDMLWPRDRWPRMKFDRPLSVGAVGGHGPIHYAVESYQPGQRIQFRFTAPKGFLGCHRFEIEPIGAERSKLRHVIEMQTVGWARVTWQIVIRPLHNALLEDALDRAEFNCGKQPKQRNWSLWVKFLRCMMRR